MTNQNHKTRNQKFIVGAHHYLGYVPQTLRILRKFELDGKRIMLEIPEYPVKFPVKSKPWRRDASFYLYWQGVADFLVSEGAEIIPGNNDQIEKEYQELFQSIKHLYPGNLREYWKKYSKIREKVISKYIADKDEHFLGVIAEEKPDGIVLGKTHALNLREKLPYYYNSMRTEVKVDKLEDKIVTTIPWENVSLVINEYQRKFPNNF